MMQLSDITPNLFPTDLLKNCKTGLCLFGAGFYGRNDAIHMYEAKLEHVDVVDTDTDKLRVMSKMYPSTFRFNSFDVEDWISLANMRPPMTYDIVSVDAPTNLFPWVLGNFDQIATLANKYIVLTMSSQLDEECHYYLDNSDWKLTDTIVRSISGLVVLLVLTRATLLTDPQDG